MDDVVQATQDLIASAMAAVAQGRGDTARAVIADALRDQPASIALHKALGDICIAVGAPQDAIASFENLVALAPADAGAWLNLGVLYRNGGDQNSALACIGRVLDLQPGNADAWVERGVVLKALGRVEEATLCYRQALLYNAKDFRAWFNLANWARDQEEFEAAKALYGEALQINELSAEAWNNLGFVLQQLNELNGGMQCFRRAALLQPDLAGVHVNIGNVHREMNELPLAVQAYQKALDLNPLQPEAHHSLALALLSLGEYAGGWKEYEWRLQCSDTGGRIGVRHFPRPLWDGSSLHGKRLLIYAEQGLGDTIQFARFLPALAAEADRVVFACYPSLLELFRTLHGNIELVDVTSPTFPDVDVYAALMSIPSLRNITAEGLQIRTPYLGPGDRPTPIADRRPYKVGLVWSTGTRNRAAQARCVPFRALLPLADITGIRWYNLQMGERANQEMQEWGNVFGFETSGARIDTMQHTATLMQELDLVLSIDTSIAHLAGALGIPVWTMIPYAADWRWLSSRRDTPWYPTMTLYRQDHPGDWATVVRAVHQDLRQRIHGPEGR